jgi:DNA-directed RNA polymerase specialized sigma24 family protein
MHVQYSEANREINLMTEINPRAPVLPIGIPEACQDMPDINACETDFDRHFARCRNLLYFIALRMLDCPQQACEAMRRTYRTASLNLPHFEYEGALRSWLLRILIDEALLMSFRSKEHATALAKNTSSEER